MIARGVRDLLFYGGFPLGYHNPESERKAAAFQAAAYRVTYTQGVGIRDPRLSRLAKVADIARDRLRPSRHAVGEPSAGTASELTAHSLLVVPPRRVGAVRAFNQAWLRRQLRDLIPDPTAAVFWVRFPSPELVDLLPRLTPRVLVYDCVDALHLTPGIEGPWAAPFHRAERTLVEACDAVVVPHPGLGERFEIWGADVRVVAHGVDLFPMPERPRRGDPTVVGFVGTLDRRIDVEIVRAIARAQPDWRIRLIGRVMEGFDPASVGDLPNVSLEPPIPFERLGEVLDGFDLGLMPYFDHPMYRGMSPVKNLELLAAGVPAVARPAPALDTYSDIVRMANSPEEFVTELREALATDSPEAAQRRRDRAEGHSWERNHATLLALLGELLARHEPVR